MNEQALILRDDSRQLVSFSEQALALKSAALETAALVGKVENATDQQVAVAAQAELQRIASLAEKARKAAKEPVLEFGRKIDAAAKSFTEELTGELTRISRMVGSFQQLEQAKAQAAERARNEELTRLERERAEAVSKAASHDAVDAINEHFCNKQAALAQDIHTPARVEGQVVKQDWSIQVTDIHKLYRMHPNCVDLKERVSEIKELLKAGATVHGVTATPITKSSVRLATQPKAIDV